MTNIAEKLSRAAWIASIELEHWGDGITHRYFRTEALRRAAIAVDRVEDLVAGVSQRLGHRVELPWRLYLKVNDLGTSLHDRWVLSGRDWEQHIQEVERLEALAEEEARGVAEANERWSEEGLRFFFLRQHQARPLTSSERSRAEAEACARTHR